MTALERTPWQVLRSPNFAGGLNNQDAGEDVAPNELTYAKNVRFVAGYLRSAPGYAAFADAFRGSAQIIANVTFSDATSEVLLLTTVTFYKLVGSQWQYVSDGTSTTLSGNEAIGQTLIGVADRTGFLVDDYIGITLSDGTQHKTQVTATGAGAGDLTIADALAVAASSGAAVVKAAALTGSLDVPADYAVAVDQAKVIFVNGVDIVKVYNRTTFVNLTTLPSAGNTLARTCIAWNQRILLGHTQEGGTLYPQRIRWCAVGDVTDWSGADAGYIDLWDREDAIQTLGTLANQLAVYRDWLITRGTYVGQTGRLVLYEAIIDNEGVFSSKTVASSGDSVIFLGRKDFYEYRGIPSLKSMGEKVAASLLTTTGVLDPTKNNRAFQMFAAESANLYFFVPTFGNNNPKLAYVLNTLTGGWSTREYTNNFTCGGLYASTSDLTWDQAPGNWEDYVQDWSSREFLTNSETLLLGGSDGQVYEIDFIATDDAGTDIPFSFATKDWFFPNAEIRVSNIAFIYSGPNLTVEWSGDGGETWEPYDTVTGAAKRQVVKAHKQIQSDRVRFRFSAAAGAFTFGWLSIFAQPAVPYL